MSLIQPSLHHLLFLCDRAHDDEVAQYEAFSGDWDAGLVASRLYTRPGLKFCLLDDEHLPLCAGGWDEIHDGVWQSWMLVREGAWRTHGVKMSRAAAKIARQMFDVGARRLELMVLSTRADAMRWYEQALGMKSYGVREHYGRGGEDAVLYARVRGV